MCAHSAAAVGEDSADSTIDGRKVTSSPCIPSDQHLCARSSIRWEARQRERRRGLMGGRQGRCGSVAPVTPDYHSGRPRRRAHRPTTSSRPRLVPQMPISHAVRHLRSYPRCPAWIPHVRPDRMQRTVLFGPPDSQKALCDGMVSTQSPVSGARAVPGNGHRGARVMFIVPRSWRRRPRASRPAGRRRNRCLRSRCRRRSRSSS